MQSTAAPVFNRRVPSYRPAGMVGHSSDESADKFSLDLGTRSLTSTSRRDEMVPCVPIEPTSPDPARLTRLIPHILVLHRAHSGRSREDSCVTCIPEPSDRGLSLGIGKCPDSGYVFGPLRCGLRWLASPGRRGLPHGLIVAERLGPTRGKGCAATLHAHQAAPRLTGTWTQFRSPFVMAKSDFWCAESGRITAASERRPASCRPTRRKIVSLQIYV